VKLDEEALAQLLDPVVFAEELLGFKPFPYQAKLLRDESKRIVICAGRQVGKSSTIAVKALHYAATSRKIVDGKPAPTTTLIVSATMRQSMLMFQRIVEFIDNSVLRYSVVRRTRTTVRFSNGNWLIALPCGRTGYSLRGYVADLIIIDEAAFVPSMIIEGVILPMLATTGGACWMLSSPWSRDHVFYRAYMSPEWSKHHWPSSASPLISKEFLEEQRALIGERRFRIEYLAEFMADEEGFFPPSLVHSCVHEFDTGLEPGLSWGYDPGGKESLAAFAAVKWVGDKAYLKYYKAFRSDSYVSVNTALADLLKLYPPRSVYVDVTGVGAPVEEHLRSLGVSVTPIKFTADTVQEMMYGLRGLMESGRLILPPDPQLLSHFDSIVAERSWTGKHIFRKREGSYDDLVYAIGLAVRGGASGGVVHVVQV